MSPNMKKEKRLKIRDPSLVESAKVALRNAFDSRNGIATLTNKSTSIEKETPIRQSILTNLKG